VYDIDKQDGQPFIAMELLKGQTLKHALVAGPLDLEKLLELGIGIADALDAAHTEGIVHRDINSQQTFLSPIAAKAKILDFGLAKLIPARRRPTPSPRSPAQPWFDEAHLTSPGATVGTVALHVTRAGASGKGIGRPTDIFLLAWFFTKWPPAAWLPRQYLRPAIFDRGFSIARR